MFKKRKGLLFVTMLTIVTLFIAACGRGNGEGNGAGEAGVGPDSLIVAQNADPITLDPGNSNDVNSSLIHKQVFNTLIFQDENMELHPSLATEWEMIDERTYQFTLRENVTFHNGEPFTADDVAFSLTRAIENAVVGPVVGMFDPATIEVIDDYTINIGTVEPFGPFLAHLAHPAASIMNREHVESLGEGEVDANPVGTGPFSFVSWERGDRVELERFDDYWDADGVPVFERLTIRTIVEAGSRTIELETQAVDIAMGIPPADIERVQGNDNLHLIEQSSLQVGMLVMNNNKPPLDNPLVREAITLAVDEQGMIDAISEGVGLVGTGPLAPPVWGDDPDIVSPGVGQDLERAKELLEEAGLTVDVDNPQIHLTFHTVNAQVNIDQATIISNWLGQIGISTNIETLEWPSYVALLDEGDQHELATIGWGAVTGDADYGLFPLFHSSQHGAAGNRSNFTSAEVDALLEQARTSTDPDERLALYSEAQQLIVDGFPVVFLNHPMQMVGTQSNIQGLVVHPSGSHNFNTVHFGAGGNGSNEEDTADATDADQTDANDAEELE